MEQLNPIIVKALVDGLMTIVTRHFQQTGEILTNERAHELLLAELDNGDSELAQEFARHGWELPK